MININDPLQMQKTPAPVAPVNLGAKADEFKQVMKEEHYKLSESNSAGQASAAIPDQKLPAELNPVSSQVAQNSYRQNISSPSSAAQKEQKINKELLDMLSFTIEKDASDLHIAVDYPPMIRLAGKLVPIHNEDLKPELVENLLVDLLEGRLKEEFEKNSDVDFSYSHPSGNRFRVNIFKSKGQFAAAFRLIPQKIKTASELGLPQVCMELVNVPQGLILFTGPTGSGKSTSIASLMQEININTDRHIITIEDPIEYVLPRARALVNQREVGIDTTGWKRALREILRQDPNVVLVGEMRDYETIASTITIAETGHLVFSTLHTNSASQSVDRMIDVFPQGQQNQVRSQLANVVTAIIAQRLVPVKQGGRKAIFEVMIATPAVKNAIREGKTYQIDNMIQTSAEIGMITLEKSLLRMVKSSDLTVEEALSYTSKPDELMSLLNNS